MVKIQLTQGKCALIDPSDAPEIAGLTWHAWFDGFNWYARRSKKYKGKVTTIYMHHAVIGRPDDGMVVDHINGDSLDNRRSNLRMVDHAVNRRNRIK